MTLWPVAWRRNGTPARSEVGEKYLAYLRSALMNLPAPHIGNAFIGKRANDLQTVLEGRGRDQQAITMIGEIRLTQLGTAIRNIVSRDVPGNLLEAGAWLGGACIYMRAVLDILGVRNRIVYVCDAWDDGFPKPDGRFAIDNASTLHTRQYFKTSNVLVRQNFTDYGYNDEQVRFVQGMFKDVLPTTDTGPLALLRCDGDLYSSTWDSLVACYDRVSPGGYIIQDDYNVIANAQEATDDFRAQRGITAPLVKVDWASVYWIKEAQ